MSGDYVIINGDLQRAADATVSVFDLGFLRGIGAFETLRTYNGLPHAVSEHLARIQHGIDDLGIQLTLSETAVRADIQRLYDACGHQELRINFIVTPGINTDGLLGADTPTWILIARALTCLPEHCYSAGVHAVCFEGERFLPHLKTTNYLIGRQGYQQAQAANAHEALYVNVDGCVTEGVTSNLLMMKDGCIIEPPLQHCLPGITKHGIQRIAHALQIPWRQQNISQDDLYQADEVWITSAVREIVPVVAVDGHTISTGVPGSYAQQLRTRYHQQCIADARTDASACLLPTDTKRSP